MKQYLDYDPDSGIAHWVETDEGTGITTYGADQDARAIFQANQDAYNADHGRWGELTHVATIPTVLFARLVMAGTISAEGEVYDQQELRKTLKTVLNDSDYRKLRTRPGVI